MLLQRFLASPHLLSPPQVSYLHESAAAPGPDFQRWLVEWLGLHACCALTPEGKLSPEFAQAVAGGGRWRPILNMLRDNWEATYAAQAKEGAAPFCVELGGMQVQEPGRCVGWSR